MNPAAFAGFLDHDYHYKSVAIRIFHNADLAQILLLLLLLLSILLIIDRLVGLVVSVSDY